jgi:glycine cleavage system H protein
MNFPSELKYSKEHTWIKIEGETGTIGITEFAQGELGEIVYVDLPGIGKHFGKDDIFGSVEAVKTTSDLFMPVGGEVIEINNSLKDNAPLVNTDSYTKGWMIKIRLSNPSELDSLLTVKAYQNLTGTD